MHGCDGGVDSFSAEDFYDGNEASGAPTSVSAYINEYDPATGATSTTNDTVTWSAIRYAGYCLLDIDSVPGSFGGSPKLRISGLRAWGTRRLREPLRGVAVSTPSVGLSFARPPPIRSLHHVVSSPDESS